MKTQIRFEERTSYAWWVHALIVFVVLAILAPLIPDLGWFPGGGRSPDGGRTPLLALALAAAIPVLFYGLFGELRTRITETEVLLAWGAAELIRKEIPFGEIRAVKAVTYSPLREFGGWGIRWGAKRKAWTTRGDRALQLELADGTLFLIGSDRPERIVPHIRAGSKGKEKEEA